MYTGKAVSEFMRLENLRNKDVAEMMGVTKATVTNWTRSNQLKVRTLLELMDKASANWTLVLSDDRGHEIYIDNGEHEFMRKFNIYKPYKKRGRKKQVKAVPVSDNQGELDEVMREVLDGDFTGGGANPWEI